MHLREGQIGYAAVAAGGKGKGVRSRLPGYGEAMMRRLAAWWRYRRRLAALAGGTLDGAYRLSPAAYARLAAQARRENGLVRRPGVR